MRQKNFPRIFTPRGRLLPRLIVAACFTFLSTFGYISTPATTYASGVPGGNVTNPFVRAVDIARPAIVRIITTIGGHLTVDFGGGKTATFPQNGGSYKLELSGSGAFITSQGDILTADHVVNPPLDKTLDAYLDQLASADVANYVNENFQVTQKYTADYTAALLVYGYLPSTSNYDAPASEVYLSTDYTGEQNATAMDALPSSVHATVDLVKQFSPVDEKDVAIIHIPRTDTPSVQVGDSTSVSPEDELRIIGFPGNGDVSDKNDPTNFLTPSINQVFVSAVKTTDNHAPVIQVGGNVEHGDSGGPALDDTGLIVGVVSFGLQQNGATGITSFLQASNSARGLMSNIHLDTKPGSFQTQWAQAFGDYSSTAAGHWHKAKNELNTLANHYTDFKAITPYLNYAQSQADKEQTPDQTTHIDYTWYIVGGVIVLLVLLILIYVATRRKKQPQQLAVAGMPAIAGFAPPTQPQHYSNPQQPPYYGDPQQPQHYSNPQQPQDAYQPTPMAPTNPFDHSAPTSSTPAAYGQTGQFHALVSEDATPTYYSNQAQMGSKPSSPDQSFQPGSSPSQPMAPINPYQPVQLSSSEQWNPYQQPAPSAQPASPQNYPPAGQTGSPYQPASPYQPVGQSYPQQPRPATPEMYPPVQPPTSGEVRPPYSPTPPARPVTGEARPPYSPVPPARPVTGEFKPSADQPLPAAPATVPPWLRPDAYARPQAQPEQPATSAEQEKTVRASGNVLSSNPNETEIRNRPSES